MTDTRQAAIDAAMESWGGAASLMEVIDHACRQWPSFRAALHAYLGDDLGELLDAAALRLGIRIYPDTWVYGQPATTTFKGEWVAVPAEDFDRLRALAARLKEPTR